MSTKTTFKRIALVAVASMGFGVLTSVAPATAAVAVVSGITAGTAGPTRVGVATTVNFTVAHAVGDTFTVTSTLTSKPALSTGAVMQVVSGATASETITRLNRAAANKFGNATVTGSSASATVSTGSAAPAATATTTTSYVAVTLTPDVAGAYQILLSTGNASYTAGDKSAVITIETAGAPATATMTTIRSEISTGGTNGSPIKVVLKDANGVVTKPNATESINLTVTSGSATLSGGATIALGSSAFAGGSATTMIKDAVADDVVVVSSSGGGTLATTTSLASTLAMTSSKSAASTAAAAATAAVWQQGTGVATTGFKLVSQTSLVYPSTATAQSIGLGTLTANGAATDTTSAIKYTIVTVADTDGAVTGVPGTSYDVTLSQAGLGATKTSALSVTATLGTTFQYTVTTTLTGATSTPLVVSGAAPAATTTSAISPAIVNSALGGTNVFTAKVTDQFGAAFPNYAVTASVSAGRNAAKAAVSVVTDALGYVSYTLTDTGTTGLTDTVQFVGPTTVTATINYGLSTVSTATLTGGNTTAGVTATTVTPYDISAGDGAELGAKTFTVTVKDVNGALLAGLPVVWTVSGTTAAITSTSKTGYTSSVGTDSADVYAWATGTYTVTATVGGVAATGTITFAQTGAGEERAISVKADGPVVTASVVDRFGNPVPGVTVYATKTGAGYFGTGVTKTSGTTATDGTVEFVIAGGSADVTVSTINYASPAGTFGSGQTSAPKGYLGNSTTAAGLALLAITPYTAGTALVDEEGVGASFDAAGVPSASVSVVNTSASDATDAAAEATDAANAATDAANAAAEAADAATAAAQDAADAVAALSAQVAEMVSALKKQITALTNLVIKIQKKVKA